MQVADKFCGSVLDFVANGSELLKGRFGDAVTVLSPLPAHFAMRHFTHLEGKDIEYEIDLINCSDDEIVDYICKKLSKGNGYFKNDVILNLKNLILTEFIFH